MNHLNLEYLESLYHQFKNSPESVGMEWRRFFEGVEFANSKDGAFGLSEKELDVYHLISAYRNYGHYEADLDPLTNTPVPSDQLSLNKFNLTEKDLDQNFQIGSLVGKPNASLRDIIKPSDCSNSLMNQFLTSGNASAHWIVNLPQYTDRKCLMISRRLALGFPTNEPI